MKQIAIMGGTFDPIHIGHLLTALFILETKKIDEIIFIPCYISPLKTDQTSSSSLHRLNMLELAISKFEGFKFSDIEVKKEGISYTYNTLTELKTLDTQINLIIGYDNYAVFDKWYKPEEIINMANVLVLNRVSGIKDTEIKYKFKDKFEFLDNPIIEISSTNIRNRVSCNKNIDLYVPCEVKEYIITNNLYK
ncbi:MAG: nicotinate-nucleotide adenylyltransferase [bacterium]